MSTNGSIFSVDDKYNVRLCITDIAGAEEYNDALQFNERVDRPDLILSKVSKELQPLEVDADFTFFRNRIPLEMPIDNYLVQGATDYKQGGVFNYETPVYPVKTYVIPIQNIAGKDSKFLELVVKHAEAIDEYDVFKNEVVKYVVYFKWNTFVRGYFLWDFILTGLLFILYLIHSVLFDDYAIQDNQARSYGVLLMILCFCLSWYFLCHEFSQMLKASGITSEGWAAAKEKFDEKRLRILKNMEKTTP